MHRKSIIKCLGAALLVFGLTAVQPAAPEAAQKAAPASEDAAPVTADTEKTDEEKTDAEKADEEKPDTEKADEEKADAEGQAGALKLSLKTYKKTFKTKKGLIYKKISYEYPVAEGDSPAAQTFNSFYKKQKKEWIKNAKNNLADAKQDRKPDVDGEGAYYADGVTCTVSRDETYISVLQNGYDYTLGAHGMPYRIAYFFKADTGEKTTAAKMLGITKKELNQKVSRLYWKKYNKMKDSADENLFYGTSLISAKNMKEELGKMDFSGSCYLKKGKLCFYVDPYALGPYAAGFIEVTMKLP